MLKKIKSDGQTGADRAALDVALRLSIPHGGWVPKGRLAEDGPIPEKYQLQEMPTKSCPARTIMNVIDSDGTVIFTHGKLSGGSKLTRDRAREFEKPWLHVDLDEIPSHLAVPAIRAWLQRYGIKTLNVAGSRASKDPEIYEAVFKVMSGVIWTEVFKDRQGEPVNDPEGPVFLPQKVGPVCLPKTLEKAVEEILEELTPEDKTAIAQMEPEEISDLQATLGLYLRERLRQWWSVNEPLWLDCVATTGEFDLDETEAAKVIIREVWERLSVAKR